MSYAGIVIGGPWAGKSFEARVALFELHVGPQMASFPTDRSIETKEIKPHRFDYVFTEMFGVKMWIPRGWSQDDIAREVFSNYRPAAVRDVPALNT